MEKLRPSYFGNKIIFLTAIFLLSAAALAQTPVVMPKNKSNISKDIQIGQQASAQVDQTFPMVNDRISEEYINQVGMRLANAVPPEFQHREFNCKFKIVNASDINAFALPGCWLYVNRGMIEAAKNEGEMAGVMAHEISHSMLRHGTAQGPSIWSQIGAIGATIGGGILAGEQGMAAGQALGAMLTTPYSRAFEKQADILGSHIMANAGYDPRDLANMFRTIAGEGGGRVPEWMSSHPDPGNRFQYINQEATMLNVSRNPIKITPGFQRAQNFMRTLPPAKTMSEIEQQAQGQQQGGQGGQTPSPTANGNYTHAVSLPSRTYRTYTNGGLSVSLPDNWRDFIQQDQNSVELTLSPDGAFGNQGITHGAMLGLQKGQGGTLQQEMTNFVQGMLQGNSYLQPRSNGFSNTSLNGQSALATALGGVSPVTGKNEIATVYGTKLSNGSLFYVITVSPEADSSNYRTAFSNVVRSARIR